MSENLVIIPTYNEKENIERIIRYVFQMPMSFDILIIEDNSPDGTADIVKRLMQEFPERLFIEERKGKLGLGTAYIHGFKWALARHYKYALGHYVTAKYWHLCERNGLHFTISETGWGKALWGKLYGQWLCEGAVFT